MPTTRRALLIDDEPLARLELRRLLGAAPGVEIAGEAGTLNDARALLGRADYDLVFLDIQLRGGSGFDLLDSVKPGAQIVFVTAYDRFALRAFEVNALDYLLKPVSGPRLAATLQRLGEARTLAVAPAAPVAAAAGRRLTMDDRVFVKTDGTTRFVPVVSICAVRSAENYTELLLHGGQTLLVLRTLKSWEETLPEAQFVRIHRQVLVNLARVKKIERSGDDEVVFHLDVPVSPLTASRRALAELRSKFAAAGLEGLLP
ncbi:LytR/AlgR family response regulator transcription factor [Oleiharenicola sp. Vm1]|uniref:LytR/AlgR family response regulator transcription factor n=1 Tax=Oleiharenicola sp. Vm1 TaxID=3398393 RepID=UPI0039F5051C